MPILGYTRDHEWVKVEDGDVATIGITSYAAEQLGDVVFVELPESGRTVKKGEGAAVVESVKAASDVYSPVSGEVVETNGELPQKPETVNKDPYGKGWMIVVKPSSAGEWDTLLSAEQYQKFVAEAGH
jgi:glycine cleavage system H protein